jgi:hypothetical protein
MAFGGFGGSRRSLVVISVMGRKMEMELRNVLFYLASIMGAIQGARSIQLGVCL